MNGPFTVGPNPQHTGWEVLDANGHVVHTNQSLVDAIHVKILLNEEHAIEAIRDQQLRQWRAAKCDNQLPE